MKPSISGLICRGASGSLPGAEGRGTFLICNEANGDTDKDERWTEIIGGMTIYKDTELKAYLEQAGFHEVQIHKKKGWLCVSAQK